MFAARVEHVAGARLHGDAQPERAEPPGDAAGAGRQVRGERVEVHVVEGEADAVVAEVGEQGEGVVQAEVGEAVGAVAEPERPRGGRGGRRGGARGAGCSRDAHPPRVLPSDRGERGDGHGGAARSGAGGEGGLERDEGADAGADGPLGERGVRG
ncbi:hypothetical protein GCM10020295_13610 [Streptomyces cinereospinus]